MSNRCTVSGAAAVRRSGSTSAAAADTRSICVSTPSGVIAVAQVRGSTLRHAAELLGDLAAAAHARRILARCQKRASKRELHFLCTTHDVPAQARERLGIGQRARAIQAAHRGEHVLELVRIDPAAPELLAQLLRLRDPLTQRIAQLT